jgi:hypothetical protein
MCDEDLNDPVNLLADKIADKLKEYGIDPDNIIIVNHTVNYNSDAIVQSIEQDLTYQDLEGNIHVTDAETANVEYRGLIGRKP